MGRRRKPAQPVPEDRYKDVMRLFIVCDNGHRYSELWDTNPIHPVGRCPECGALLEADHYGPDTRTDDRVTDGWPYRMVEVPADTPVRVFADALREARARRAEAPQ